MVERPESVTRGGGAPHSYSMCGVFRTPAGGEGKDQDTERKQKCTGLGNVASPSAVSSAGFPGSGSLAVISACCSSGTKTEEDFP